MEEFDFFGIVGGEACDGLVGAVVVEGACLIDDELGTVSILVVCVGGGLCACRVGVSGDGCEWHEAGSCDDCEGGGSCCDCVCVSHVFSFVGYGNDLDYSGCFDFAGVGFVVPLVSSRRLFPRWLSLSCYLIKFRLC